MRRSSKSNAKAQKIGQLLQREFPNESFSLRIEQDAVCISWVEDTPVPNQIHSNTDGLVQNQAPHASACDDLKGKTRLFLVEHQEQLTAEQHFKYDILLNILRQEESMPGLDKVLLRNGGFIDATFAAMAEQFYRS